MRRPSIILIHLGYWFLYLLLLGILLIVANIQLRRAADISTIAALLMLCVPANLFAFYSCYFWIFNRLLRNSRWLALAIYGGGVCLASALVTTVISAAIFGADQPVFRSLSEFAAMTISLVLLAAVHGTIALVTRGFVSWFDEKALKDELAEKNFRAEIALIKSSIDPHFLFNTINNIDVLITKDPTRASAYLNKLSDILRHMVYETKDETILLEKEISNIENYIELQRIRTKNEGYIKFHSMGESTDIRIAPMIFFPFIENAVKHTENNKNGNSIDVGIEVIEGRIDFYCRNTFQATPAKEQQYGGSGNDLIKRRLELVYPGLHRLQVDRSDGVYQVKLTIYGN